jgi:hypothetical protein
LEFAARSPLDRPIERNWRVGGKPQIEARKVSGRINDADHARNFLDCVKSRQTPSCDLEFGHRCTSAALVANIAHKTRSYLQWDALSRAVHEQGESQRAAALSISLAVSTAGHRMTVANEDGQPDHLAM